MITHTEIQQNIVKTRALLNEAEHNLALKFTDRIEFQKQIVLAINVLEDLNEKIAGEIVINK